MEDLQRNKVWALIITALLKRKEYETMQDFIEDSLEILGYIESDKY